MNMRGWVPIDDNAPELDETVRAELDELARRWSVLAGEQEAKGFRRQAAFEDGEDYEFDSPEDEAACKARERLADRLVELQMSNIAQLMEERGARMMRPYEHWNEDERYMEYMECGRFGNDGY